MKFRKRVNIGMIAGFVTFLIASFVFLVVKPSADFSENENRSLAQLPAMTLSKVADGSFMDDFEDYVNDQFYARSFFVSLKAQTEKLIGKTENNGVFFAQDQYLIGKLQSNAFSEVDQSLTAMKKFAQNGKGTYQVEFLLCPTAAEVLKNKLPSFGYSDYQTELYSYVAKSFHNSDIKFIDVRSAFTGALNTNRQLYYKTDHHYTSFAAFLAYSEYMKANGMTPLSESDFTIETVADNFYGSQWTKAALFTAQPDSIMRYVSKKGSTCHIDIIDGDKIISQDSLYFNEYLSKKDKYSYFLSGVKPLYEITTNVKNGKSILLFKDSYAHEKTSSIN